MISLLPAQRRAEQFAELIETEPDQLSDDARTRHRELLATVSALRDVEAPVARPEFVTELRAQLMAEADVALSPVEQKLALPSHPRSRRDRRLALVGGTVALLGATTSVAVAAQGALPGDTLYPVKRALEGAHSSLTFGDQAKAETVLDQASGRLAEVEALARQIDTQNESQVPSTLDAFAAQADKGADLVLEKYADDAEPEPVAELGAFVDRSMKKLVGLDALLPAAATDSLNKAAKVLSSIHDRIASACPACELGVLEVPARLIPALRVTTSGAMVSPSKAPAVEIPAGEANQSIDPDDVVDLPTNALDDVIDKVTDPKLSKDDGTNNSNSPTKDEPVKKVTKHVGDLADKVGKTVEDGTDALLGDESLLGGILNPLVDPLLGTRRSDGN